MSKYEISEDKENQYERKENWGDHGIDKTQKKI